MQRAVKSYGGIAPAANIRSIWHTALFGLIKYLFFDPRTGKRCWRKRIKKEIEIAQLRVQIRGRGKGDRGREGRGALGLLTGESPFSF